MEFFVGGGPADFAEFEGGFFEDGFVDVAGVVEEIARLGGVGGYGGGSEAEVGLVFGDELVDAGVVDGDGGQRRGEGDLCAVGVLFAEHAALEVVVGGGVAGVVVPGDEEDAGVVEGEGLGGVVGDDDAEGHEAVVEVVETGVGAGLFEVAGVDRDRDAVVGVVKGVGFRIGGGWGDAGFVFRPSWGQGWQAREPDGNCNEEPRV